jgi:hypothetical protein
LPSLRSVFVNHPLWYCSTASSKGSVGFGHSLLRTLHGRGELLQFLHCIGCKIGLSRQTTRRRPLLALLISIAARNRRRRLGRLRLRLLLS